VRIFTAEYNKTGKSNTEKASQIMRKKGCVNEIY